MTEDLGWRDATIKVLRTRGEAMHYKDIAEAIKENGFRETMGATPAAAVFTAIRLSMKKFPESTPFIQSGDGWFLLKSDTGHQIAPEVQNQEVEDEEVVESEIEGTVENENETLVQAFGMYWERSLIPESVSRLPAHPIFV